MFYDLFTYSQLPFVGAAIIGLTLAIIYLFFYMRKRAIEKEEKEFISKINAFSNPALANAKKEEENLIDAWNSLWYNKFKEAKLINPSQISEKRVGFGMLILPLFVLLIFSLTTNIGLAIPPYAATYFAINVYLSIKAKKYQTMIEQQIPSFLSALKSNIQANLTPEIALIQAIDITDYPLKDELIDTKRIAISTSDFGAALAKLRVTTTSKDIKFLCSCIELAAETGTNLEEQIVRIEEVIVARKKIEDLLSSAVSENKPLLYVSSVLIPGLFYYMYSASQSAKDFWFKVPLSWIIFFAVIILFSGSVLIMNIFIKKIEKFKK